METYEAERLVSENLIQLEEDFQRLAVGQQKPVAKQPDSEPVDDSPVYFRYCNMSQILLKGLLEPHPARGELPAVSRGAAEACRQAAGLRTC